MLPRPFGIVFLLAMTSCSSISFVSCRPDGKPNFLIFMVDDLGSSDLGCYGNDSLKTPNIDRLASEGVQLMHHVSPESICTPSRAAFMTGRHAVRSGLGASENGICRVFFHGATSGGLPREEKTFAALLKDSGYHTGMVGKWHLGSNCESPDDFCHHPNNHGFDHFYGMPLTNLRECGVDQNQLSITHILPHLERIISICFQGSLAIIVTVVLFRSGSLKRLRTWLLVLGGILLVISFTFYTYVFITRRSACILMRQKEVVEQPIQLKDLTQRLTSEAVWFLKNSQKQESDKPFLMYMSFVKVHTALFTTDAYTGHSKHSRYGDNVEEMDASVGVILKTLKDLGLDDSTFVYFTSDHGPHLEEVFDNEYQGGWKGILKGGKGQSWEGGIRVPGIARWPGVIPNNLKLKSPSTSLDVFTTVLKAANVNIPNDRTIDSRDMMPLFKGDDKSRHNFMPHFCGTSLHAVTYPKLDGKIWKVHYVTPVWSNGTQACHYDALCGCHGNIVERQDPPLLYELTSDPREMNPLPPHSESYQIILDEISTQIKPFLEGIGDVTNQVDSQYFIPWLQPHCNFPFYTCKEVYPRDLVTL